MLMVFKMVSPNVKVICVGREAQGVGAGVLYLARGDEPRGAGPNLIYITLYQMRWQAIGRKRVNRFSSAVTIHSSTRFRQRGLEISFAGTVSALYRHRAYGNGHISGCPIGTFRQFSYYHAYKISGESRHDELFGLISCLRFTSQLS